MTSWTVTACTGLRAMRRCAGSVSGRSRTRWHQGKAVLTGDAAHTTHFSIGLGTKLAIEDAISPVGHLHRHDDVRRALRA